MQHIIDTASYMAHGYCLLWKPWLVSLHALSDLTIALSYAAIPVAIMIFIRRRTDLKFDNLARLFAAFILLCGLTHLLGLVTLWYPIYETQGVVKAVTAAVSLATAIVIFPLIPKALAIPSPSALQAVNADLQAEVAAHRETLEELRAAKDQLERRVAERTAELAEANERLHVVARELVHRSKNTLTVVQSLAHQTASSSTTKQDFVAKLNGRLASLAAALDAVVRNDQRAADLRDLVDSQLGHYTASYGDRIEIDGPAVRVRSEAAQQIGLAIHELATNAVKYGALAGSEGRVHVRWQIEADGDQKSETLVFDWYEDGASGASPSEQADEGFGTRLITRAVPMALSGVASRSTENHHFRYQLKVPLEKLRPIERATDSLLTPCPLDGTVSPHSSVSKRRIISAVRSFSDEK